MVGWNHNQGEEPKMSVNAPYYPEATFDGMPVMLSVCGVHSRSRGAELWYASGGGLYVGSTCDIVGCPGE